MTDAISTTSQDPTTTACGDAHDDAKPVHKVAFVSLGCPKNLVDSEKMLGLLAQDGLIPVADETEADAIVINTCGFLEASKDESIEEIQNASTLKKEGSCKRVIVAGCLVQRHRAKMLEWCPDIDAMIGVFDRDRIVEAVTGNTANATQGNDIGSDIPVYSSIAANASIAKQARAMEENAEKNRGYFESDGARLRLTPRHYSYLRISEGCNQNCTFCTIPSIRGKMRSKPVDSIISEARELFADGAFELNLIGQDTTSFGDDIGYDAGLVGMLQALDQEASNNGEAWLRLMYAYPSCFSDEMIDAIANLDNVVKYIDMPLQHINDQVLNNMRRHTSRELIETLLEKLRERIPGMAIRTTFISGFPGETQEQHDELVAFVDSFGFDAMGVFPYSPEPGTPAARLHSESGVQDEIIQQRIEELMLTQQAVVFEQNEAQAEAGLELDILIDEQSSMQAAATTGVSTGGTLFVGRAYHQAPQVDSVTYVQAAAALSPGELVRCKVIAADGYDLIARPIDELTKKMSLPIL